LLTSLVLFLAYSVFCFPLFFYFISRHPPKNTTAALKKKLKKIYNSSTKVVEESLTISDLVLVNARKVSSIKHELHKMINNSAAPNLKMMVFIQKDVKKAKEFLQHAKRYFEEEVQALAQTNPTEKHKIVLLKKAVERSQIAVTRAEKDALGISNFLQDSAQAAVRQAKVELEQNVMDSKATKLDVHV